MNDRRGKKRKEKKGREKKKLRKKTKKENKERKQRKKTKKETTEKIETNDVELEVVASVIGVLDVDWIAEVVMLVCDPVCWYMDKNTLTDKLMR